MDGIMGKLSKVMHPEISSSLVELGMIGEAKEEGGRIYVELKVPFLEIPIKPMLVDSIKAALAGREEVDVSVTVMSPEEKERFMALAQKNWAL